LGIQGSPAVFAGDLETDVELTRVSAYPEPLRADPRWNPPVEDCRRREPEPATPSGPHGS
jgi:hypothetical protein